MSGLPESELYHFVVSGVVEGKRKTVKIPEIRLGWILNPFGVVGHLKIAATGEVLHLMKEPAAHGFKKGKENRTELVFVPIKPSPEARAGSQPAPGSRPSVPDAAAAAGSVTSPEKQQSASSFGSSSNKDAAQQQGIVVSSPTPGAGGARAANNNNPNPNASAGNSTSGQSRQPTPTPNSVAVTPKAGTPKVAGAGALAAARDNDKSSNSNKPAPNIAAELQLQMSSSDLRGMASLSSFGPQDSTTFTVVDGVATLQRPRGAGGAVDAANKSGRTPASEEVVAVPVGESLSRVSATLTPRGGNSTPGSMSPSRPTPKSTPIREEQTQQQQQQALGARDQKNAQSRSAASSGQEWEQTASAAGGAKAARSRDLPPTSGTGAVPLQQPLVSAEQLERERELQMRELQLQQREQQLRQREQESQQRQRAMQEQQQQQQQQSAVEPQAAKPAKGQDPVVVAYVQLPDGRREPVYYKDGAAKPVFLVNTAAAVAPGSGAAADGSTYLISTPRSTAGGDAAATASVPRAAGDTPTGSAYGGQRSSSGRFGEGGGSKTGAGVVNSTQRFSSPSPATAQQHQHDRLAAMQAASDPQRQFFDQDMHNAAEAALNPMSSTELNEQVNELRTILFTEQQRREELESRLSHLFGVADSWATLRHSLTTATAGHHMMMTEQQNLHGGYNNYGSSGRGDSAFGGAAGANETPRNALLMMPPAAPSQSSFMRVNAEEAAVLAEHERQLEELRRQRLIIASSMQQKKSPGL